MTPTEEIAALRARLDVLEKQVNKWPQVGDRYFYIYPSGVGDDHWAGLYLDRERKAIGNVYRTITEAERELQKRRVIVKMRGMTKSFVPNWQDEHQFKYYPYYDHSEGCWCNGAVREYQYGFLFPYFATEADCQAALDALGDEMNVFLDGEQ